METKVVDCWACDQETNGISVNPSQHDHVVTPVELEVEKAVETKTHGGHSAKPIKLSTAVKERMRDLFARDRTYSVTGMLKIRCSCGQIIGVVCGCGKAPYLCIEHAMEFVRDYHF